MCQVGTLLPFHIALILSSSTLIITLFIPTLPHSSYLSYNYHHISYITIWNSNTYFI